MKTELHLPCNKKFVPPGTEDKMEIILIMPCCAGLLVCFLSLWAAVVQKGPH